MKERAQFARLDGRATVTSGGAGRLGRAVGEALAELGAGVAVHNLLVAGGWTV